MSRWREGAQVMGNNPTDIAVEIIRAIFNGRHLYIRGRFYHNGWCLSWHVSYIRSLAQTGPVFYATNNMTPAMEHAERGELPF